MPQAHAASAPRDSSAPDRSPARADDVPPVRADHGKALARKADLDQLARKLLAIAPSAASTPLDIYVRLGARLESLGSFDLAAQLYRRVHALNPQALDTEVALYRLWRLAKQNASYRSEASEACREILRLFPQGQMALQARAALQRSGAASDIVFSAGNAAPAAGAAPRSNALSTQARR